MDTSREPVDERVSGRADDAPAEEKRAGRDDAAAQAAAVLAESDERQDGREASGGSVEHHSVSDDGPAPDL
ncbi:MAG TPA: hypothetical protein VFN68_07345 [Acidimicrobiales bacterium]|nr:hypothetical protein [Acidimicrobiales bacterium]